MSPKRGRVFPERNLAYATTIASALRDELGNTHQATKTLMRWTGTNERTAKSWLAGTNGPRGENLVRILRHSDQALSVFLELADRKPLIADKELLRVRNQLAKAVGLIDLLSGKPEP